MKIGLFQSFDKMKQNTVEWSLNLMFPAELDEDSIQLFYLCPSSRFNVLQHGRPILSRRVKDSGCKSYLTARIQNYSFSRSNSGTIIDHIYHDRTEILG